MFAALARALGAESASGPDSREATNLPPLRVVGQDILELGEIRLDKQQRTMSFPAVVNQSEGLVEYLLVSGYGKTHESVLRTEVPPVHIHVAMLLLGAGGPGTNQLAAKPPEYGGTPGLGISGDPVAIELSWRQKSKEIVRRAAEVVSPGAPGSAKGHPRWIYNGSAVWQGVFLAQECGSLISLITDSAALVNQASAVHGDERSWTARSAKLPPVNTAVRVTVRLESSKTTATSKTQKKNPQPPAK
jgi:hypothetical protein